MSMLWGMEILAMPPVYRQSGSELLANLDCRMAVIALMKTEALQIMGRLQEMGTAQEVGARDTVELVSERYRFDPAEVRKDLALADQLGKYPEVAAALPDAGDPLRAGVISLDHAKVIVQTLNKAPASVAAETLAVAEEQMVNVARGSSPRELAKFGQDVLARLDTDGPEPAEDEAVAKEYLRLRPTEGGVKFSGFLAGASAEQFQTQNHALSKPHKTVDGEQDPRSADQRRADALKTTMDAAAGNPDYPGVPHITVTIDFNDLKAAMAAGAPAAFGGAAGDGTAGGGAVGELVFGANLSAGAVRLLACDAAVLPIVLGGDSQPLDVGSEQRFVNRYIRRALNKRDGGCVVCKAPPWMCHAHHVIHWANGGPTSLQNLALLCAAHHRAVHNGQWAITITAKGVQVTRPTWAAPAPITDRAAITGLIDWSTPAHNTSDSASSGTASNGSAHASSASSGSADCASGGSGTSASRPGADRASPSNVNPSTTDSRGTSATASSAAASWADAVWRDASSDPAHEQPSLPPAVSTHPDPE
ncbi:HNH endonuclease, partial [Kribbella albertanoniae]